MIMKTNGGTSIIALVPAYNESASIRATIESLLAQDRPLDQIVIIPNGCTDDTADIAREYPVTVFELPKLEHKKSQALNMAWAEFSGDYDILICMDADTVLPPNAIKDWEEEFQANENLAGSSSKFTMQQEGFLPRLQKFEFAKWTFTSLKRGWTSVLAGTGCAVRNSVLKQIVSDEGRTGPWSYDSQVEDFELTYQIRKRGHLCWVSPTVRAYTDSMRDLKSLWNQRMKWQVGTVEDLMSIGYNKYTRLDWLQQAAGLGYALIRVLWIACLLLLAISGNMYFTWYWWVIPPVMFILGDVKSAMMIPHRDKKDIWMAATLIPQEFFSWVRAAWFISAWAEVLKTKITGDRKDRWSLQYKAEGVS